MNKTKLFYKTEQSTIYETPNKTLIKKFNSSKDFSNELKAYNFLKKKGIIGLPLVISIGEKELELEKLEQETTPTTREIVESIAPIYLEENFPQFRKYDLSKKKLIDRIRYLADEIDGRGVSPNLLEKAEQFVNKIYCETTSSSLVHGDLKPIHAMKTKEGVKFIDFALFGEANPWYDLSFLHMAEQTDKERMFKELIKLSSAFTDLEIAERKSLLQSNIFNRTLYNFGFALRHRPDKSLERTIRELSHIMEFKP